MKTLRCLLLLAVVSCTTASKARVAAADLALRPAPAQQSQTDSAIVRITLAAAFSEIGFDLAEVVAGPPTNAWRIDFPKTNALWVSAAENVSRLLNLRTPAGSDSGEHYLMIREHLVSDTVRTFQVTIGQKWRCGGHQDRWVAADRTFEVRLAFRAHIWRRVPSNSLLVYGDPGICEP